MYRVSAIVALALTGAIVTVRPTNAGASPMLTRSSSAAIAMAGLAHPSHAQIAAIMSRTFEAQDHREHFVPFGTRLTIKDGRGTGTLTAVVGVRYPTADAHGQVVFFWHNSRFIGWDSPWEKTQIVKVSSPAAGAFSVTYARYKRSDPLCCPTLKPRVVHSGWSGTMLISDGVPPKGPGKPVKIVRLH